LKKLAVPLIPLDQCTKDYSIFKDLTENQICAGGKIGTKILFPILFLNSKNDSYLKLFHVYFDFKVFFLGQNRQFLGIRVLAYLVSRLTTVTNLW
jgi:hypothetical protein